MQLGEVEKRSASAMTEFSPTTRLIATFLLILLGFVTWKWLQPTELGASTSSTSKKDKKKSKKSKKKSKKADEADARSADDGAGIGSGPEACAEKKISSDTAVAEASSASTSAPVENVDEVSDSTDSDEDEGLSAVQVLAKRKFKTKAIGRPKIVHVQEDIPKYAANERVFARFQSGNEWFPATILEARRGNEYNIRYDDGEVEYHVSYRLIRPFVEEENNAGDEQQLVDSGSKVTAPVHHVVASLRNDSDGNDEGSEGGTEDDDGWQVVSASVKRGTSKSARNVSAASDANEEQASDGLTKRQRENRRKKERQRELKEAVRAQAQEQGLHARWGGTHNKYKYVPPPTSQ
ncbi:TPA: hypothetical protein N0F65_006047 [Lagenidium giganteum]|uniref:DNA repair protein Crb2 Tudor domain-containing protein n=1 Tax=Lagenidium giganteum TaxID=4803 RepID=A0AAV2YJF3_9STRA|nr:TPA: hypothetical protein N0F65_006047 [Lagenidium giganteum]